MKNMTLFKRLFLLFAVVTFASCDNEPVEGEFEAYNPPTDNVESNFQVDVDGVTFVADQAQAITQNGVTSISGTKNNGTTVMMTLSGSGTGTYNLGIADGNAGGYAVAGETPFVLDTEDTDAVVEITDYDVTAGLISGTFSYRVTHTIDDENGEEIIETVELTNGSFTNISLDSDIAPPPSSDALFEVELDGDLFSSENVLANINEDGLVIQALVDNEQFIIQIFDPSVGTFSIGNDAGTEGIILYDPDSTNEESLLYSAVSGTLTISSLDMNNNIVAGTFSGTLEEALGEGPDIAMTNGLFDDVSFSIQDSPNMATATVDGQNFDANIFAIAGVGGSNTMQIIFEDNLDNIIQLTLPQDVSTGTYTITDAPNDYSGNVTLINTSYGSIAGQGEIEITSTTGGIIEGTFSFTAEDLSDPTSTIQVENGDFVMDVN